MCKLIKWSLLLVYFWKDCFKTGWGWEVPYAGQRDMGEKTVHRDTEEQPRTIILTFALHGSVACGQEEGKWHLWFSPYETLDLPSFMLQQAQCGAEASRAVLEALGCRALLGEEAIRMFGSDANCKTPAPPSGCFVVDFLLMFIFTTN